MTSCFTYIFYCVKIELVHSDYFFVYDFVQNHFDLGSYYGFFLLIVQVHYTTTLASLEDEFEIEMEAEDIIPENFNTISAIANVVRLRQVN